MKKLGLTAACVAAALGAFAAVGLGEGSSDPSSIRSAGDVRSVPVHRVDAAEAKAGAASAQASGGSGLKMNYFETNTFTVAFGTSEAFRLACPKHWKAFGGYFANDGDVVVPTYSAIDGSPRKWDITIRNESSDTDALAFLGVVCVKGIPLG